MTLAFAFPYHKVWGSSKPLPYVTVIREGESLSHCQLTRVELSALFPALQLSAWQKGCLLKRVWGLGKRDIGMLLMDLCLSTLYSPLHPTPAKCFLESCLVPSGSMGPYVHKKALHSLSVASQLL